MDVYDKLKKDKKSSALASLVICIYLCIMSILLWIPCHYYGTTLLFIKCMNANKFALDKRVFELINWNLYTVIYIAHVFEINQISKEWYNDVSACGSLGDPIKNFKFSYLLYVSVSFSDNGDGDDGVLH